MSLDFIIGADAAIVLDYNDTNHAVIAGMGKLAPPGASRSIITIEEFRADFSRKFAGGATYDEITLGGNMVVGDTLGQDVMRSHFINKTKLVGRELMCFLDLNHFFTTDLANDSSSSMQIGSWKSGEVGKNDAFPISGTIIPNGRLAIYTAHMVEAATPTLAFVQGTAAADTITDSDSGFVTAGFKVGQTLLVLDSTSNDANHTTITGVTAGTLTLASEGVFTSEAGVEGMELHGGSF